ncbi:MAG: cyclic nucleotide-binding domain-containing protein [Rhodospirillales bacterium]|nr:cyclic nucleotide-binding domain-containing protein [Rhodospirillales bacterium]
MAFNGTFSMLGIDERRSLLESGVKRRFKNGQLIIRQGIVLQGIFVVTKGEVRVEHGVRVLRKTRVMGQDGATRMREIPGRLSVEVARLGRGAIFGEMSFVDDSPTSASVAAVGDVETVFIDAAQMNLRLEQEPEFGKRFYHSLAIELAKRLREANKRSRGGRPHVKAKGKQGAA